MAVVTLKTNRLDLFCLEHLGTNDDQTRRNVIRWNTEYFAANPTFWLDVGRDLWTVPPPLPTYGKLLVGPGTYLKVNADGELIV